MCYMNKHAYEIMFNCWYTFTAALLSLSPFYCIALYTPIIKIFLSLSILCMNINNSQLNNVISSISQSSSDWQSPAAQPTNHWPLYLYTLWYLIHFHACACFIMFYCAESWTNICLSDLIAKTACLTIHNWIKCLWKNH